MSTISQARWIRRFRWLHRKIAIILFVFFFFISITGLLLGIKKQTGMLAPTESGVSSDLSQWLSMDSLTTLAVRFLKDSVNSELGTELDRIDVRPGKGIAKFLFVDHYWGLQLDCVTGELLSVEERQSDFIEDLHDGSIIDRIVGAGDEPFKVGYTVIMGISLFMLTLTGFWLWYGPKRLRKIKRNIHV